MTNIRQPSSLEEEIAEFKRCYDPDEDLSPMENAVRAFEAWFIKRRMGQPALQQAQQKMSQMTLQGYASMQTEYSPREEGRTMQSTPFPNTTPFQGRAEMPRLSSHQQILQSSSNQHEFQDILTPARRNITDPHLGYPGYQAYEPVELNVTQLPGQQTMYTPEFDNLTMWQPQNTYANTSDFPLESQNAVPTNYEVSGNLDNNPFNHSKYSSPTPFNMNGVPQFQQNNVVALSQQPTYNPNQPKYGPNQPQGYNAHQPQVWATPSGSTDYQEHGDHIPMQSQQATHTLSYPKPHPQRSVAPDTARYFNPNAGADP
jgi:hypothetical protein